MTNNDAPRIALGPESAPGWLGDAIVEGGGELVGLEAAEAIVWGDNADPVGLLAALERAPGARWVQLPFAGIENFVDHLDRERTWTCAKGAYADPCAELALALALMGLRGAVAYARETEWSAPSGTNLLGGRVTIIGGGGITESLVRLLAPFDCHVTVVRNRAQAMDGVDDVLEADRFADALPGADVVVLALSLTPETVGMFGEIEFALMESHAWIVNVARGKHIVTDDLVAALERGTIGGAALDVTDPEPLPPGHPLWSLPNCVITPHVACTAEMAVKPLVDRVIENVGRFGRGEELLGLVDVEAGY